MVHLKKMKAVGAFLVAFVVVAFVCVWRMEVMDDEDIAMILSTVGEHSPAFFVKNHDLQEKLACVDHSIPFLQRIRGRQTALTRINSLLGPYHIYVFLDGGKTNKQGESRALEWEYDCCSENKITVFFRSCSFEGDGKSLENFERLLEALQSGKVEAITFDMRGNGGGNSCHGDAIIESIFGRHAIDWLTANYYRATHYRLTEENLKRFAANGEQNIEILREHFNAGKHMYVEFPESKSADLFVRRENIPHIRVIMDDKLFSAAANFVEMLQVFDENVEIVGNRGVFAYSHGDVDSRRLKSGRGSFIFPMKYFEMRGDIPMRVIPTQFK
jgi:hypothetical protein